jgi:Leucine-rich repeat (LRR) protein
MMGKNGGNKMRRINLFLSFVLTGLLIVSSVSIPMHAAIPASERAALVALYKAANGDNWYDNSGWKTPPLDTDGFAMPGTEGSWFGVLVVGDHVTAVALNNNWLSGSIPSEIGNLGGLAALALNDNQLGGSIPPELGNLGGLAALALNNNLVEGSIPSELGNLGGLAALALNNNLLSGSIPAELGNLGGLAALALNNNLLSGSIPAALGNLGGLAALALNNNRLSGSIPSELGNLGNLAALALNNNRLSGSIPAELGNLVKLAALALNDNQLSGSIPPALGNLTNLAALEMGYNQLNGSIPSEFGNLVNLEELALNDNQLSGSIPSQLGKLNNVKRFTLGWNQLSGSIPSELGNLGSLEHLTLSYNKLSGTIPSNLGSLGNLWSLSLEANQLTGDIPSSLTNLSNLVGLYFWGNCLSVNDPALRAWLTGFDQEWESNQCNSPFGSFDTPIEGSSVASSIAVTGWALDASGVTSVKIYREQNNQLIYIGDALFVEGARPDVYDAYTVYPNSSKAGWGYMLLTNFLPNSGNGTFVLHAIASNAFGKTVTLGTKTITCDNANAVKPFGAIDTPTQGGTASGSSFVNWGWVLTPQPNSIPTNGSSIDVWVDGVKIGNPAYNVYRSDIASLFPGYANSNGAIGYFYLDTTAYDNGVHTIQWTAKDSGGNSDGFGSRYFSIQNTGGARASSTASAASSNREFSDIGIDALKKLPIDYNTAVKIRKGGDIEAADIYPDINGLTIVVIKEMERLELDFSNYTTDFSQISGYMKGGDKLYPLPVGSTLAAGERKFYWQPGPGFIGEYLLVFIEKEQGMTASRKDIKVKIVPKFE